MNPSQPEKTLKPPQRIALLALAAGERPQLVAARARVSIATLYRWRRNPVFQQALAAALDNYHDSSLPSPRGRRPLGGNWRPNPRLCNPAQIPRPPENGTKIPENRA